MKIELNESTKLNEKYSYCLRYLSNKQIFALVKLLHTKKLISDKFFINKIYEKRESHYLEWGLNEANNNYEWLLVEERFFKNEAANAEILFEQKSENKKLMKIELNRNYAYDLSKLNGSEMNAITDYLNESVRDSSDAHNLYNRWIGDHKYRVYLFYSEDRGAWVYELKEYVEKEVINAKLLFERHKEATSEKPKQYQVGIDTFERAEANLTKDQIIACVKFNIDKYNWRNKEQDIQDFEKIISYAQWAIKNLKNE